MVSCSLSGQSQGLRTVACHCWGLGSTPRTRGHIGMEFLVGPILLSERFSLGCLVLLFQEKVIFHFPIRSGIVGDKVHWEYAPCENYLTCLGSGA